MLNRPAGGIVRDSILPGDAKNLAHTLNMEVLQSPDMTPVWGPRFIAVQQCINADSIVNRRFCLKPQVVAHLAANTSYCLSGAVYSTVYLLIH